MIGKLFRDLDLAAGLDDTVKRQLPATDVLDGNTLVVEEDEHLMLMFALLDELGKDDILGIF